MYVYRIGPELSLIEVPVAPVEVMIYECRGIILDIISARDT
jgi:hypothetical protein